MYNLNYTALCQDHHVWVPSDNDFQRRARLLQALWREEKGYPVGLHNDQPLGSRLAMPFAEETLDNYLTEAIREVVYVEVQGHPQDAGQLYARPRIFNDLLSSQPLCFNLFGELRITPPLATAVFADLTSRRVGEAEVLRFEYSPGRRNPRYTDDRTASDVFLGYQTPSGKKGGIGIEVKYHESMDDPPARHRERYDEVAAAAGIFREDRLNELHQAPLQQIWRDHLLVLSMIQAGDIDEGCFAFVYPKDNHKCAAAITRYLDCLTRTDTIAVWTLNEVVSAIRRNGGSLLAAMLTDRYLAFGKIDRLLKGAR
jgi:hypothetical protein